MSSDERLAARAARGDRLAFEAIYRRYHQDLYRFCLAMVGNRQDAQDALQNTMVKVLRALPGEQRQIRLKPWLYRIARNEAIETLRRRRDSDALDPEQAAVGGVAEAAEARERLRTLLADLEQLPERQRAALVMRELAGLDFDQIGAAFETSAAVARQTLYEARLSLRRLEEGREMRCADVMRELSDADGRVARRREIRAHLRGCPDCRDFCDEIASRREGLAAITPLPLAASVGLLRGALGGTIAASGTGSAGGGLGGTIGAGAGKAVATSAVVKSAATVAVVAVVGVSAADRGGLVDLPIAGKRDRSGPIVPPAANSRLRSESTIAGGAAPGAGGARGAAAAARKDDTPGNGDQIDRREHEHRSTGTRDVASGGDSSRSQAGLSPPGGGFGNSASARHGRPDRLPAAADKGQQTASAHRPSKSKAATSGKPPKEGTAKPSKGHAAAPPDQSAAKKPAPPAASPNPPPPQGALPDTAKGASPAQGSPPTANH